MVCAEEQIRDSLKESPLFKNVRWVEIPTTGALRLEWILDAIENGAAGVVVLACRPGQCRHPGADAACRSMLERARTLLAQLGLPHGRIHYCQPAEGEDLTHLLAAKLEICLRS